VPTTLQQGELAVNITDKKMWVGNAATTPVQLFGAGADGSFANLAYTGTLTGGTGIVNLGSGQFYKDASGNIGIGTTSPVSFGAGNQGLTINGTGNNQNIVWRVNGTTVAAAYTNGTSGFLFGTENSSPLQLQTAGVERMRITSAGDVGIGTSSPDNNANYKTLTITGSTTTTGGVIGFKSSDGSAFAQIFNDSTSFALKNNSATPTTIFTSGLERMRIDSSGNVGILNSNPATILETGTWGTGLAVGSTSATHNITIASSTTSTLSALRFGDGGSGVYDQGFVNYNHTNNSMNFGTNRADRMTIDSSGQVGIGISSPANLFDVLSTVSYTGNIGKFRAQNSTTYIGSVLVVTGDRTTTNSSYNLINCFNGSGTGVLLVRDSGNCLNTNNSYGGTSDVKLKENIVDATPKLNDLMQVKVRHYNFKNKPNEKQIGVVAQELETVFPSMIEESPDCDLDGNLLETTTKSVKYSVFVPMLIKAMQEQQALITNLTTRLTALENK
jgi:hypothetical protein